MAQIIKHRRGQLSGVKSLTARNAEFIIASGSISDLNGPFVFIGSPNGTDEGVAGAFKSVSTIYQGTTAPTITAGSYGSILDGTPFYASGNESLYILNNDGAGGNIRLDLTGNIEGNLISGVTINNITGTTANIKNISGSFTGSGIGLYDIPASGITGLELNRISSGLATASISELGGLKVNVKTEITGALIVTGNITGSNMYLTGSAKIDGNITGSNMYLTGSTKIDGDITGSNMYLTGDAKIDGNITLGGNITVGDSSTDFVTFGAEISSSIVPDVHNAFDLGSPNKNWRNLHVSGTAYVDVLDARQVNFNDLGILTDLSVSGNTYLGNGGDITVVSGSLYNDQLTNNRVVIAGVRGVLEDDANFTFDGIKLSVGAGDFEVDVLSGDTRMSGSLSVSGSANFNSTLDVKGNASFSGSVDLGDMSTDEVIVSGTLRTHNTTYLGDMNTSMGDALIVSGGIKVSGSQTISNDLIVSGNVYLGDMVTDSTIVSGTLYTHNVTNLGDMNTIYGDALIVSGAMRLRGDEILNGNLIVSGNAAYGQSSGDTITLTSSLYTHNTSYIGDMNTVYGDALIISGAIKQTGNQNVDGNVSITGSLTNSGSLNVSGGASVTGAFTVGSGSITSLGGDLYVSGNLQVLGSSTSVQLQSNTVEIGDNIILLNAYSPFQRYAGIEVIDSGSSGVSASMVWDSQNDYWMFVSASGQSSKFVGTTAGSYGSETSLTSGTFPIASGNNTIGDSLLTYSGTTLAFNTNKFTIDSGNGNTMVSGNFTLSYSGGTDNGSKTSAILFRNSSNVVGFVTTTETTDVMDGILGYKHSGGGLVFSTVIDGGTY